MDITIHASFLPHDDPEATLAFYRDTLGFEVRSDVGNGPMRWITVGPEGQPDTSILLAPPAVDPGITDDDGQICATRHTCNCFLAILSCLANLVIDFRMWKSPPNRLDESFGLRPCFRIRTELHDRVSRCVRSQQNDRILEVYLAALAVLEHSFIKHLVEELHDIRMGFLYFIQ